jgi:plasmid stabilization system protein ParE
MSYTLIVRPEAEQDMADGRDWYDRQRAGLGGEFLTAVEDVFDRIAQMPELYAAEYREVRRARLRRFPYIVYYRIHGDTVQVLAVLHASRNPRDWRSRA